MRRGMLSLLLVTIAAFSACNANQEALQSVSHANNLFSSELYDVVRKSNITDNLIASPISVSTVLAMLDAGARGSTRDAIRSSLHFPTSEEQLNAGYQTLLSLLRSDDHVTLEIVNKIYPAEGYKLNPEFINTLKTYYSAEPQQLNFAKNVEAAGVINNFVSNATHEKIHDLVASSDLDEYTRLVLINAIYFKGQWKEKFPKEQTKKMDFYANGEEPAVKVDMMTLEKDFQYAEIPELDAKVVSLPYQGDRFSMIILLPNKRNGLVEMEAKLKSFPLDKIIDNLRERKVLLYLPRFKVESKIDLKEPLKTLGLEEIFNSTTADLSGIPAEGLKEKLFVTKAFQKAFIEVNEEGSEAAAATGIIFGVGSAAPTMPIIFRVDHPFMSFIVTNGHSAKERLSQNLLFYSRVNKI